MKELNRRGVLANALAGRDEKEISRVLNFLIRYVLCLWSLYFASQILYHPMRDTFSLIFVENWWNSEFVNFIKQNFYLVGISLSQDLHLF